MKDTIPFGERCAILLSRFMATWIFIIILFSVLALIIVGRNLTDGEPLDVFNLGVSLYTLFVDVVILKAALSLRNMDRTMMEMMLRIDKKILAKEEEQIKMIKELMLLVRAKK